MGGGGGWEEFFGGWRGKLSAVRSGKDEGRRLEVAVLERMMCILD